MVTTNGEIAKILSEIGEYLDMQNVPFKPRAYEKAAETVAALTEEISETYKKGGLKAVESVPGIGVSIAEKIEELLKTGRLKYYEELKKKTPVNLGELTAIEGIGPKSIKKLYEKLDVKNVADLEKAARAGKIGKLAGFGPKSEESILKGIEFAKSSGGRFVLGYVMPEIRLLQERLGKLRDVKKIEVAGSIRRRKETVGDADFLIISDNPKPVMDYFVNMPEVVRVYAHGATKSAVKIKTGMDVDLRVIPPESYGAALAYFTGSKDHNVALRELAIKKGYKLNEYGLFQITDRHGLNTDRNGKSPRESVSSRHKSVLVAGKTEEEIYKALGLDYVEPEMREMMGELELTKKHKLPKLINYGDLLGDLQVQTNWTDGSDSIEAMARAAMKAGLQYIAITDHTKRLAMTHGLDEKRIVQQAKEIDRLNSKFAYSAEAASVAKARQILNSKFRILKGTECDILKDGSMDLPDEILAKLDVVGASVHSHFDLPREEQTRRIEKAMRNRHVDIIFHPTGRVIQKRPPYELDMATLVKTAKETGTIMEIDAFPDRLDLRDEYIRQCVAAGVKMSIDSDAHSPAHFEFLEYGVAQARRGWAEKSDIINAWPLQKMLKFLKR